MFVRTIGLARATVTIGLANLVYNMRRLLGATPRRSALNTRRGGRPVSRASLNLNSPTRAGTYHQAAGQRHSAIGRLNG